MNNSKVNFANVAQQSPETCYIWLNILSNFNLTNYLANTER